MTFGAKASAFADLANNGFSVLARLCGGVALFVMVGRFLGPAGFGDFVFAMAVASLIAFVGSLGFNLQVLRELAARPSDASDTADVLASARLTLSALAVAASIVVASVLGGLWWVVALLTFALVCDGAMDFLFALMKAQGRYELEARFVTSASLLHFVIVAAVAYFTRDLMLISAAFCLSRLCLFAVCVVVVGSQIRLPRLGGALRRQWDEIRAGWAYTLDVGLSVAASQLDTILVRVLLGAPAAGIYQAGMRVVVGMQNFSVVAGNVFVPRLTRSTANRPVWDATVKKAQHLYLALALGGGLAVWLVGWLLTRYGYGPEFAPLLSLWPWLAGLFALRMLAASYGIRLTALGAQSFRSVVNFVVLAVISCLVIASVHMGLGLAGVLGSLTAGALVVLLAYRARAIRLGDAL